eukprot:PhM_4_TR10893/c1_g1_i6/m.19553
MQRESAAHIAFCVKRAASTCLRRRASPTAGASSQRGTSAWRSVYAYRQRATCAASERCMSNAEANTFERSCGCFKSPQIRVGVAEYVSSAPTVEHRSETHAGASNTA